LGSSIVRSAPTENQEADFVLALWVIRSPWRHAGGHAPFSLAFMTAVGERTAQVVLGTNVLTATFRYNPAVSAKAFATMACLCPDRVVLGLGGKG
jgi:alkanesulfonate monooxygenase SsuD/methylene tetrahydromethanopterin reductase-like flavin-dependent oxidoreductase (luciferase family)